MRDSTRPHRPFFMRVALCLALATALATTAPGLSAAPRPLGGLNPNTLEGKIHLGKGKWVTPDEARELGYFEYHQRWFPARMRSKLARWEKQDKKHRAWADARRITSKHYRIVTNVPRFIVETELKPFLDELYRTYTAVFKSQFGLRSKAANKKFIHIHRSFEDYARNNPSCGRPRSRSNPGFIMGGSVLVVYYDVTEPEQFYSAAFHEGAHQFVQAMLPGARFPKWIDEALATYFEGCSYSRTAQKITVDYLPPDRLRLAQHLLRQQQRGQQSYTLADVLTVADAEFNARYYALSWSFAYFMTHAENGLRKKRFIKFLKAMNGAGVKRTPAEIFARVVKVAPLELENDWRRFVLGLKADASLRSPILTRVKRNRAGLDLKQGDIIRSFNYRPVTSSAHFNKLWAERPKERPTRLLIVRRTPVAGPTRFRAQLIELIIPPQDLVQMISAGSLPRDPNLSD